VSVGTGFFLDVGHDPVFITAAHVLDGLREGREYFFYVGPATERKITGDVLFWKLPASGHRKDDVIDVCVVVLKGDPDELPPFPDAGKLALPVDRVAPQAAPRAGLRYAALGFPSSKDEGESRSEERSLCVLCLSQLVVSAERYASLGLEEEFHIVLPFAKRNVVTLGGQSFNFPKLQGMSGAPLWELRTAADGGRRVVGVMIEHRSRENVLVASDIWFALRMLAGVLRHLAGAWLAARDIRGHQFPAFREGAALTDRQLGRAIAP
jgi:hypothetical protein